MVVQSVSEYPGTEHIAHISWTEMISRIVRKRIIFLNKLAFFLLDLWDAINVSTCSNVLKINPAGGNDPGAAKWAFS